MNTKRIYGVILRHLYHYRHSLERQFDSFFWPAVDLILWGITSRFLVSGKSNMSELLLIILTGLVFWQVIWRAQYEITVSILDEIWSKNFLSLFSSPLTIIEWLTAVLILGFFKMFLTIGFAIGLAYWLYQVNVLSLNMALIPFMASLLIMGWWVGIFVAGVIVRFGIQVQIFAWAGVYLLSPFCAVFYPLSTLPPWAQTVARFIPGSYIFEGMRIYLVTNQIPVFDLAMSFGLNFVYLIFSLWFFARMFEKSRELGLGRLE
jgi:ABC-2 type transport system permease protein